MHKICACFFHHLTLKVTNPSALFLRQSHLLANVIAVLLCYNNQIFLGQFQSLWRFLWKQIHFLEIGQTSLWPLFLNFELFKPSGLHSSFSSSILSCFLLSCLLMPTTTLGRRRAYKTYLDRQSLSI